MKVGYIRVSTKDQNTARQEVLMEELGVEKVYIEKVSGKDKNRPELKKMLDFIREGDTVIVESISRFARNTKDLLGLIETLEQKQVQFISKKEQIDTRTPAGKFMLTIFGAVAELEREYMLDRQAEGIAIAKAEGKHLGRPSKVKITDPEFITAYNEWKAGKRTAKATYDEVLKISRASFYRLVKDYEQNQ